MVPTATSADFSGVLDPTILQLLINNFIPNIYIYISRSNIYFRKEDLHRPLSNNANAHASKKYMPGHKGMIICHLHFYQTREKRQDTPSDRSFNFVPNSFARSTLLHSDPAIW
jgi:hypothetical protein